MTKLEEMAAEVAEDQEAVDGTKEEIRDRVIRMGRKLRKMQKEQKKEQAETGQTWKDWCEEQKGSLGAFPSFANCKRYALISRYPLAYEEGMSIKEAYRKAGEWKRNGGNKPVARKRPSIRTLGTIGAAATKIEGRINKLENKDLAELATEEKWTDEEIVGSTEALILARQAINYMLRKLRELEAAST